MHTLHVEHPITDFDAEAAAVAFLEILRTRVWGVAANSPALAGDPVARILVVEDLFQVAVGHDLAR
ncbi:hypothetical protein [Antrihabitans spumae]|uniref:Uncharacterized protein n=1 Tax=Antrihabitans spumae TaxID=3373370 RepID=A0ABW7KRL8_9NOCA